MSSNSKIPVIHWLVVALVVVAIVSRLIPHPPNFTPVGAVGLFAGAYLTIKRFWLVPVVALLISDYFLGAYNTISMLMVYVGFMISALLGRYWLANGITPLKVGGSILLTSLQFFIVTNLGVWLSGLMYPMTLAGLIDCYVMAIPFFGNSLAGDLFYGAILFGGFSAISSFVHRESPRTV